MTEPIRVPIRYGLVAELYLREPPPPPPSSVGDEPTPWEQSDLDEQGAPPW